MAPTLSYPLRIARNGALVAIEQESDAGDTEALVCTILTRKGERGLRTGFGIIDPTFAGFEPTELAAQVAAFGPPVELDEVDVRPVSDTVQRVRVEFHRP